MTTTILTVFIVYTILILLIAHITSKKSTNEAFLTAIVNLHGLLLHTA